MRSFTRTTLAVTAAALALALAVLVGCGGSGSGSTATKGTDTSSGNAVADEAVGVAVYPGTNPEEIFTGIYTMVTSDGFDEVLEFYRGELPDAIFSEISIETGRGASFMVTEGDSYRNVSVEENLPESGSVTITVSEVKSE